MTKIEVRLNPDVTPTGSDLAVVNAARRSFNTRSEWDVACVSSEELEDSGETYNKWSCVETFHDPYLGYEFRKLKEKDKRLLQFLARGMTADDFEQFKLSVGDDGLKWLYWMDNNKEQDLVEKLWQWRNTPTHDTPFNHCFISFEVKAPVFVRAQLVKHEYLIMSEFSRRYITDGVDIYTHEYRESVENKKQGSGGKHPFWNHGVGTGYMEEVYEHYNNSIDLYKKMVTQGVSPEQARGVLPQDTMTEWSWSGTLGAFAKMCQLRLHPEAQYESRLVAREVYNYLLQYYPVSAKALVEGPDV